MPPLIVMAGPDHPYQPIAATTGQRRL